MVRRPNRDVVTDVLPPDIHESIRQADTHEKGLVKPSDSMLSLVTLFDSQESGSSSLCIPCKCDDGDDGCMKVRSITESLKDDCHKKKKRPSYIETLDHGVIEIDIDTDDDIGLSGMVYKDKTLKSQFPDFAKPKSVRFDTVEIREHASILGCNPGVTSGPPLTICWKVLNSQILPLEEYEASRGPRRSALFLKRSKTEREQLLLRSGFDKDQIQKAEELAKAIRSSREESAAERSELQALMRESKRKTQHKRNQKKQRKGLFRGIFRGKAKTAPCA